MKLVGTGHVNVKVFNHSDLCACGKPGDIAANDIKGEGALGEPQLLKIICAKCAADQVRQLPMCNWLQLVALMRTSAKGNVEWRKYKVHSLNESSNRARVVIIDASNQFLSGSMRDVRCDALCPSCRIIDSTFQITGTRIEVELFENSALR